MTNVLPMDEKATGVSLMAQGGAARVKSVSLWEMGSIWQDSK
jgi:hypothetical protein